MLLNLMFLDEAIIDFASGRGGSGAVSFHREKHVPRGGPNGADGGRGGDVILIADRNKRTLYDLKLQGRFEAPNGSHALNNKRGKDGKKLEIKVPVGTVITDEETGALLADLNTNGHRHVLCKGGRGGKGNQHYTTSVRQAPNFAEKGEPGERLRVKMELKLVADVGLIGLPNAGKSTLISRISAARPKIADYPFTTIVPNLGVVSVADSTFVVADMPGLIAGASEGHGLGHQFLKHVERTRVLIHVVDCFPIDESDPVANFELIESELRLYNEALAERPRLIALSKVDLIPHDQFDGLRQRLEGLEQPLYPISAVTGEGLDNLLYATKELLDEAPEEAPAPIVVPSMRAAEDADDWDVQRIEDGFEVTGKKVARMVAMTNLESEDAVRYLHRRLQGLGVIDRLRELGAEEGDTVYVGDTVFAYTER
jgi:GTPase